jgi:hypothetical protein
MVACLALGSAACQDELTGPVSSGQAPPESARSQSSAPPTKSPYVCFTSRAVTGRPYLYEYNHLILDFPTGAVARDGSTMEYGYRGVTPEGEIVAVANCIIPRTRAAIDLTHRRFRVPGDAQITFRLPGGGSTGDVGTMETCGGEDNPCPIPGIIVVVRQPSAPPAGEEPVGGGGGTPMPTNPPPAGGGTNPCTSCSPQATPVLQCTASVTRTGSVSCTVSLADGTRPDVTAWRFDGNGLVVNGPAGGTAWTGPAVVGGVVSATANGQSLTSSFTVTSRGWNWGPAQWSFQQGAADILFNAEPGVGVYLGWNCTVGGCGTERRVIPDIANNNQAGYQVAQVPSGPNTGIWYVSSVDYRMNRASNINPQAEANAPKRTLPEGSQAQECRSRMNLAAGAAVQVNFYTFNEYCKGLNMGAFLSAVWSHEGFGSSGSNGHESQGRAAASRPENNIFAEVEPFVFATETQLRDEVLRVVSRIQQTVNDEGKQEPSGNWSGQFWVWNGVDAYMPVSQNF